MAEEHQKPNSACMAREEIGFYFDSVALMLHR